MIGNDGFIYCDADDCENKIPNHKWGKIKAIGWYFKKDGRAYCPNHYPTWAKKKG